MGFNGIMPLAQAVENGQTWQSFFYKTSLPSGAAARWYDGSVGAGIPIYQAYVGGQYEATQIIGSANRGIYTGPVPNENQTKHLFSMSAGTLSSAVPITLLLADYLMFYPLVDMDSTDAQDMIQSASLPRYSTGKGVQAYFVVSAPITNSGLITVLYTNSEGVPNRSTTFGISAFSVIGGLVNTARDATSTAGLSPFIPLANGDNGIRSIERVTCSTPFGGFCHIVLVKPLATHVVREQNTEAETVFFTHKANCVQIQNNSYLNFLILNNAAGSPTPLRGFLQFTWN